MSIELELVDRLINNINDNKYKTNEKLPSENEMANRYNVPRITIRNAYNKLQEMGYISSQQGIGSFVNKNNEQIELALTSNMSFTKKMLRKGYNFYTENVYSYKVSYNKKIYTLLNIKIHDEVYKIGRLRFIDNKPIALHTSYIPKSIFNNVDKDGNQIKSIFEYYNKHGYTSFYSKKSTLSVSFPSSEERKLLKCTTLIPILKLECSCINKKTQKILGYNEVLYRGDCFKYNL